MEMKDLYQSADWKAEKHVPVIECPGEVKRGEAFAVEVSIGKAIAHPNTTAHHISWVTVYFKPAEGKFPYEIAKAEFVSHGASTDGADTSTVYTHPSVTVHFRTDKPGTIVAASYCNIHGLWQSSKEIKVK